jgi:hypothetical protein
MCATRRARWATVNAGRTDGENKLTIEACVFGDDCLPELIVIHHVTDFMFSGIVNLSGSCGQT